MLWFFYTNWKIRDILLRRRIHVSDSGDTCRTDTALRESIQRSEGNWPRQADHANYEDEETDE